MINNILSPASPISSTYEWDERKDLIRALLKSMGQPAAHHRKEGIKNLTNRLNKLMSLQPPPTTKITAI